MALPIRQRLSAITCLKAGPKAVLIEVCELAENGGKGCIVSNDGLAKKLGISLATATRTVASLVGSDLLVSEVVKAEGNRRYLTPTAAVRACYIGGSKEDQLAAVVKLTIVKNDTDYSQNGEVTIVKSDADYSQNASRVYRDDQYDQLKTTIDDQAKELASLRAALTSAQSDLVLMTAERDKLAEEVTSLKAQSQASHTRGARPKKPKAPPGPTDLAAYTLPDWAGPEMIAALAEWVCHRQTRTDFKPLQADAIQARIDELANYDEAFCLRLFQQAKQNPHWQGLTFDNTPMKFAQYLQAQQPNHYANGTHNRQYPGSRNGQPQPGGRFDLEEAVYMSRDIAVGVDAAQRAEAAAGRHDGNQASYSNSRPSALSYTSGTAGGRS